MDKQKIEAFIQVLSEKAKQEPKPEYREVSATIRFTKEECKKMGGSVGAYLSTIGRVARVIKRAYADRTVYIVRLRRNGINVEAMDEDIHEAKRKFAEKTFEREREQVLGM